MKRHDSLRPLSREHHHALALARVLRHAEDAEQRRAARDRLAKQWAAVLVPHFADEERWLLPLLTAEEADHLTGDHDTLRELASSVITSEPADPPAHQVFRELGVRLHDHIRWEERDLFEALQRRASRALDELLEPMLEIEQHRQSACRT